MQALWEKLKGSKSYIVAAATILYAVVSWWNGSLTESEALAMIFGGAGLGTLRHGMTTTTKLILPLVLVVGLGACATSTPKSEVAALQVALTSANTVAMAYVGLPPCPRQGLCSDTSVVEKLRPVSQNAFIAVTGLRNVVNAWGTDSSAYANALTIAKAALGAYQSFVANLRVN